MCDISSNDSNDISVSLKPTSSSFFLTNKMHIYTITNRRQTSGNLLKTWYKWKAMPSTRANGKCINNTSVYFNKQCHRCHVTTSFLLGQCEAGSSSELPEVVCLSKGALIQAWKYEYSLDTLWLFIAFLSWPKRFHFSSSCCNQFRGDPWAPRAPRLW